MMITEFSHKQLLAMKWWNMRNYGDRDAIICDGAVRSGKTLSMSLGFIFWASKCFKGGSFAMCGKTITSLRRNVITPMLPLLTEYGYIINEKVSRNYFDMTFLGSTNRVYLFGGKDEGSAALIQGMTLSGVFFDEVALMPRSFVEQALARCSVSGSKMWFNCNPDNPSHWFYNEWIKKLKQKNALYLHFTMEDNPSLTKRVRERYERMYSGTFYDRFVLGKWTASQGVVYPMFSAEKHVFSGDISCERYVISCDYGTVNPSSFGLWGLSGGVWYRLREYYYDSRREGSSRTDEEHYAALDELAGDRAVEKVIVDPSAASFIECIRRHGKFRVTKADNDVISGIRQVSTALKQGRLRFHESCRDIIREFSLYCWNERAGADAPVKENDHAMDDMRYFVTDMVRSQGGGELIALSVAR
ncbi:PBSX family phage terminase large subunit [Ruminococcus flavefaciens]|uniref:PBSX family phage terminase large subunit n=1 Tax=Ruminococcus flavefaciens TaxID=1265 RepID=A0A315XVR4_RUMFL|nr:PBSX family phage terminase large subunit [Ruminococcus flavefaciens]PWJ10623.1 PBSX family phage terminase large subunit [Ruminococcus flavefaciens]SSA51710.1 phage terminase, large subunit, PBSX family [Ruminococcus flavefaciens]